MDERGNKKKTPAIRVEVPHVLGFFGPVPVFEDGTVDTAAILSIMSQARLCRKGKCSHVSHAVADGRVTKDPDSEEDK